VQHVMDSPCFREAEPVWRRGNLSDYLKVLRFGEFFAIVSLFDVRPFQPYFIPISKPLIRSLIICLDLFFHACWALPLLPGCALIVVMSGMLLLLMVECARGTYPKNDSKGTF